jgi:SPP1 gp7 family putative phage head morphogenesis protein
MGVVTRHVGYEIDGVLYDGVEVAGDTTAMSAHFAALKDTVRDVATAYFEANGFRMASNLTDGARSIIQQELLQAVKNGGRAEDVVPIIYDRLIRRGFITLDAVLVEEPRESVLERVEELLADALDTANVPAYLNTLVRTNTFEALNEARFAEFTDPALADFVVALEYSAIMDERTTEICSELDGHVHAKGSAVWDKFRPPNHYNCRSVLIPITAIDGWDGEESEEPEGEPQEGFGRGA